MGKYTRISSSYILRKKHKTLTGSQILERDWTTVGGLDRFTPGKKPYYRGGNFVFTSNSVPSSQKKHVYGKWIGEWTYDDVKNITSSVNEVKVNQSSNDLRDFAYFGSCVEMVRASIENIIKYFPAQITVSDNLISVPPSTEYNYISDNSILTTTSDEDSFVYIEDYYVIDNPFEIDLHHTGIQYEDNVNMLRYMDYSMMDYVVFVSKTLTGGTEFGVGKGTATVTMQAGSTLSSITVVKVTYDSDYEREIKETYVIMPSSDSSTLEWELETYKFSGFIVVDDKEYSLSLTYSGGSYSIIASFNGSGEISIDGVTFIVTSDDETYTILNEDGEEAEPTFTFIETDISGEYTVSDSLINVTSETIITITLSDYANYSITLGVGSNDTYTVNASNVISSYTIVWTDADSNGNPLSYEEYYCNYQYKVVVTIIINGTYSEIETHTVSVTTANCSIASVEITEDNNFYDTESISGNIILYGYQIGDSIVFVTNVSSLIIKPKENIIEEYFNDLDGFERQLLNRETTPLYKNTFITPVEYNKGVKYVYRDYTWPSSDYQINITSPLYTSYVNGLLKIATFFDELWCDNMYRGMTHEAIKNYDWTYTRDFAEGEEEDNVDGGNRMESTIRLIGAFFDSIKRYVDGIKTSSKTTYDSFNNQPDSLLSDKIELCGIDAYSIVPTINDVIMSDISLTQSFLNNNNIEWYSAFNIAEVTATNVDNEFMRRMLINATHIMRSKGTKHAIDMMFGMFGFGENDYTLTEEYRTTEPKIYGINYDCFTEIDTVYWIANETINEGTYVIYYTSLYLCISDNTLSSFFDDDGNYNEEYYELLDVNEWENGVTYYVGDYAYYDGKYYICTEEHISDGISEIFYEINQNKNLIRYYDDEDEYSGVPLKNVYIGNEKYVVPYIDESKTYDGYIYFQTKGGWGFNKDDDAEIEYMETQNYMGVVPTVTDLFEINPNRLNDHDIYYVINISDLLDYDENATLNEMSHMFYVKDKYATQSYTGWCNINAINDDSSSGDDSNGSVNIETYIKKKAEYLENLISTNENNNPHVGFGNYDRGECYFDYMSQPFKYAIDNNYLDAIYISKAEENTYDIKKYNGDKIINHFSMGSDSLDSDDSSDNDTKNYYLNSKVFTITNNIDNDLYKQYFKDVILNYIIQVIPSTTILILENFSTTDW